MVGLATFRGPKIATGGYRLKPPSLTCSEKYFVLFFASFTTRPQDFFCFENSPEFKPRNLGHEKTPTQGECSFMEEPLGLGHVPQPRESGGQS